MKSGKKNSPESDSAGDVVFTDEYFMRAAVREAEKAEMNGEVPVGAVAVKDGMIIARAWNQVELLKDATAHAEILVLTAASELLGDWRMDGVTVYVTKEPCPMCAGALVNARVERVVYGMGDPRSGACGSSPLNVIAYSGNLHQVQVRGGVLEEICRQQFQEFFRSVRESKNQKKESLS